ncbi:MAG TPA: hypothetical protein PKE17_19250 [Saprospiraceae bacterium]|nr:hypothetical protein [Saprospiraceae bacterium]
MPTRVVLTLDNFHHPLSSDWTIWRLIHPDTGQLAGINLFDAQTIPTAPS